MSTHMLDNLHAAFDRPQVSPLFGQPYNEGPGGITVGDHKLDDLKLYHVPDWTPRTLTADLAALVAAGCHYAILDGQPYSLGDTMDTITQAHGYGLAIVVRNPQRLGVLQVMAHSNTAGIIVEAGHGSPAEHDDPRRRARRDGLLPIWFVFNADDEFGAHVAVEEINRGGFTGMEVVLRG